MRFKGEKTTSDFLLNLKKTWERQVSANLDLDFFLSDVKKIVRGTKRQSCPPLIFRKKIKKIKINLTQFILTLLIFVNLWSLKELYCSNSDRKWKFIIQPLVFKLQQWIITEMFNKSRKDTKKKKKPNKKPSFESLLLLYKEIKSKALNVL